MVCALLPNCASDIITILYQYFVDFYDVILTVYQHTSDTLKLQKHNRTIIHISLDRSRKIMWIQRKNSPQNDIRVQNYQFFNVHIKWRIEKFIQHSDDLTILIRLIMSKLKKLIRLLLKRLFEMNYFFIIFLDLSNGVGIIFQLCLW